VQLSRVADHRGEARFQNQSEKVIWISEENAVSLRFGEWQRANDLSNPTHIVTLVGIEWREHLIGGQRHRREKLDTVSFPLSCKKHYAVVEPISPLLRRKAGNVGGANARSSYLVVRRDSAVVETCLRKRVLGSIDRTAWPGVEPATRRHREKRQECESGNYPRKRIRFGLRHGGSRRADRRSAAMAELRSGVERGGATGANRTRQWGATTGAVAASAGRAAGWTGSRAVGDGA